MKRMKAGVVGTGMISDIYLENMIRRFGNIEVVSCCAAHMEHAMEKAEKYGIKACTYDQMLADPQIEIIVVLTRVPQHYEIIRRALERGKHVFTEKTMTLELHEAEELSGIAGEKGLYLCSAPDTFLGSAVQTAGEAIRSGKIGEIYSFHISANRNLDCIAAMVDFLREPGGGICQDYGVYYLAVLCSLFGGVEKISAVTRNNRPVRLNTYPKSPQFGQEYPYANESQVAAVITMRNGVTGTFSLNGDSNFVDLADFVIYGTRGILKLGAANQYGGRVQYIPTMYGIEKNLTVEELKPVSSFSDDCRGIGVAEMADAIVKGRKSRTDYRFAYHIFEVVERILQCSMQEGEKTILSGCEQPEPFSEPEDWSGMLAGEMK